MNYLENWEYAVPEGWLKTEWWGKLIQEVEGFVAKWGSDEEPFHILQVKEKWGQLRVYAAFDFDAWGEWDEMISYYEEISGRTCMTCGSYVEIKKRKEIISCDHCKAL